MAGCASHITTLNQLENLFDAIHNLFGQAENLYMLFAIFEHTQFLFIREQIENLATVDFKEAGRNNQI